MREDIDQICARENELSVYLDAEVAKRQRVLRIVYKKLEKSLAETTEALINTACDKNYTEAERQRRVANLQEEAKVLEKKIREYEAEDPRVRENKIRRELVMELGG